MYLTQGLHRAVQQTPDEPATIFGERVRTWRQHVGRVARLAGALRELGVTDGERVGILAGNSDRYLELMSAVPWANGVLNPLNARWSPRELGYALRESQTAILMADDATAACLAAVECPGLKTIVHLGDGPAPAGTLGYEDLAASAEPASDARRGRDALAAIFYTGGTTGFPKGVMLSHANLVTSALGTLATVPLTVPGGRALLTTQMFHLSGVAVWALQLAAGGSFVILPAFEPRAVLAAIEQHRVTFTCLVPTMLQSLLDHPAFSGYDSSSLRSLLYAGSPMSETLLGRVMKELPRTALTQAYGMTELAPIATLLAPEDHRDSDRKNSVGRAAAHAEVRVVDDRGEPVPDGIAGEIVARGANTMLGYWNKPDQTAEALRGGWMHTGDVGYLDDGYIHLIDRLKDMIITGGSNVYPAEVENAVGAHPAVAACAVIGVPDAASGERVHAIIVTRPGRHVTAEEIRAHCQAHIAGYKVPASFEFTHALPLSAAGKVLKRELRKPHWEGMDRQVN